MTRLADLVPAAMTPDQRRIHDDIVGGPRGKIDGPFNAWLRSPELCDRAQKLGAFCRYQTSLPARLSELAILTVARHTSCQVEWYLHEPIARAAGVSPEVVAAIRERRPPPLAGADTQAVHALVRELLETHRISDATYGAAVAALGETGTVELVGIVGYYVLVAMTLNGFEVPVPDGAPPPLED
jgi:4-carboxymuconolactone decarboxylase